LGEKSICRRGKREAIGTLAVAGDSRREVGEVVGVWGKIGPVEGKINNTTYEGGRWKKVITGLFPRKKGEVSKEEPAPSSKEKMTTSVDDAAPQSSGGRGKRGGLKEKKGILYK